MIRSTLTVLSTAAALLAAAAGAAEAKPGAPCPRLSADTPEARAVLMRSNYTTDGFAMRRERGRSECTFSAPGEGLCRLQRPGAVHVTTARTNVYFVVPRGRSAEIAVSNGVARCRLM